MKVSFTAVIFFVFLLSSCSKDKNVDRNVRVYTDDEAPSIKIFTPLNVPVLRAGEILTVRSNMTDNRQVAEISWEVMNGASACGSSPYKGVINPRQQSFDMDIQFFAPTNFSGNKLLRLVAMDNGGNSTVHDVNFTIID